MQLLNVNLAFLSGLLLAQGVLTAHSERDAPLTRHSGGLLSQPNNRMYQFDDTTPNTLYSTNWAGAIWIKDNNTFNYVTGTFTVPTPKGVDGAAGAVWVGLDGDTCQSAILQTGIEFTMQGGKPTYNAWYEWYPDMAYFIPNFGISAGDNIKLTVVARSKTSGTIEIENLTTGQIVVEPASYDVPLCGQNAEWIVEDFQRNGGLVPFADFGTVTFTHAAATGPTTNYGLAGAIPIDLTQDNKTITSVSNTGSSLTITYK